MAVAESVAQADTRFACVIRKTDDISTVNERRASLSAIAQPLVCILRRLSYLRDG